MNGNFRTERLRVLSGHSLGGLFALHVPASAPDAFDAYLAASPSADWDDGLVVKELAPGFERLGAARFPEDGHGLVPLPTTVQGLRFTFDGYLPPLDPDTGRYAGSLEDLEAHYRALSTRLGYQVLPPEGLVNLLGYQRLGEGRIGEAVAAFQANVRRHPGSANAHDSLGEALEASGRLADAASAYERAVELGEASGSRLLPEYRKHLRAAQRRLGEPAAPPGIGR